VLGEEPLEVVVGRAEWKVSDIDVDAHWCFSFHWMGMTWVPRGLQTGWLLTPSAGMPRTRPEHDGTFDPPLRLDPHSTCRLRVGPDYHVKSSRRVTRGVRVAF
jgi:hypothetical protein